MVICSLGLNSLHLYIIVHYESPYVTPILFCIALLIGVDSARPFLPLPWRIRCNCKGQIFVRPHAALGSLASVVPICHSNSIASQMLFSIVAKVQYIHFCPLEHCCHVLFMCARVCVWRACVCGYVLVVCVCVLCVHVCARACTWVCTYVCVYINADCVWAITELLCMH